MRRKWNPVSGDDPTAWDVHLEAILVGESAAPAGADSGLREVSAMLAALAVAPPGPSELLGQAEALAAYRTAVGVRPNRQQTRPGRIHVLQSSRSARAAAVLAAAASLSMGGVAAAAYTGSLPGGAQGIAHRAIGAPAGKPRTTPSTVPSSAATATPAGPNVASAAAFGLCTAWKHAQIHGSAADKSVAFTNLVTAAGGADNVASYCASIPHPGAAATTHPGGQPTSLPSEAPTTHPGGQPTSLPSEAPTTHPGGEPTSLPTPSTNNPSTSHHP
jgi:hypothetical protein